MKKLILTLCILIGLAGSAWGAYDYTYTQSGGDATITGYTGAGGAITIPATIDGYTVTVIDSLAFEGKTAITSVVIPEGVTTIGFGAFMDCPNITTYSIPSTVSDLGLSWCSNNTGLQSITVSASNATYSSISGVLYNKMGTVLLKYPIAKSGTSFSVPSGVTTIGDSAFSIATNLTSITLNNGLLSIGSSAFGNCNNLSSITIPSSVTNIYEQPFIWDVNLTTITVDSSNANYKSLDDAILTKDGTTLKVVAPGKSGTYSIPSGVTNIYSKAMWTCQKLTRVNIPNTVTNIESMAFESDNLLIGIYFYGCAPAIGVDTFCGVTATGYYKSGATGFTNPWNGLPTTTFSEETTAAGSKKKLIWSIADKPTDFEYYRTLWQQGK